ncbi:ABC transporter ATP-binding protein [Aminicella lysinilytica]|uniref:ABC-2 type transport system ATP-binding protein n=1 Tax=Aminicella lysinilytica TaxID=433323 RepID=A0A4R6PYG4_9FIRM|nr:ABC transporter ATP-binding protein [Aminicella lysinilytica]TDP48323.1 ABC-2 type transport system ATP-binding protein [Aminicella lysinilytica]
MAMIECRNLTKYYGHTRALNGVDLTIEKGQIVGLLGPNGSGKTTMIKMANGLLQPTNGSIIIDGHDPGVESKSVVAYLPDRDFLPEYMTVDALFKMYGDFFTDFNREKAEKMLASLDIRRDVAIKKLSKGTREKVQLVLIMSRDAKVYLLDEPIAGVDPAARDYILKTIISNYCEDAIVMISTHLIADIESILDDVIFLKDGNVVVHEPADQLREERGKSIDGLFREVFKC